MTLQELINTLNLLRGKNLDARYDTDTQFYAEKYFYQLIRKYNGFDRNGFSQMANYFYDNMNYIKEPDWNYQNYEHAMEEINGYLIPGKGYDWAGRILLETSKLSFIDADMALNNKDYDNVREFMKANPTATIHEINYIYNRIKPMPMIEGIYDNDISCDLICVNPNSKNLDAVLDYISLFCESQMSERNSFILKDKSTYDDRHFVNDIYDLLSYEGNYMKFGFNKDLIFKDLEKYLGGEITLDQYLDTVEFRINAYMNE